MKMIRKPIMKFHVLLKLLFHENRHFPRLPSLGWEVSHPKPCARTPHPPQDAQKAEMVQQVVAMGVDVTQAFQALERTNYQSVEAALNSIFGS